MSERRVTRWCSWLLLGLCLTWFVGCGNDVPVDTSVVPLGMDVATLIQNLDAKSAPKRDNAARYLGELGAKGELGENADKVLAKLKELSQKDPNPNVKATATEAVGKIEGGG